MIVSAHRTHPGHKRKHNEDTVLAVPDLNLWLVADGMGGHDHGEVASALARDILLAAVEDGLPLDKAIQEANEAVCSKATGDYTGMGTTVVATHLDKNRFRVDWVGDSRAYHYQAAGDSLRQITTDHSYVQELLAGGAISPEQAENHPQRHVITQALGVTAPADLRVDTVKGKLRPGDVLLLCSDGLNNELDDEAIAEILGQNKSLEQKADQLVQSALDNGGSDNVSVALLALKD
ncbi:MAG: Stp1/IreP family PP2C-type Ser/Thr phosphatase [Gammaproteobacteria bacterium]|nr:MAG: Stp1/IreP family PP2C-type Ser/Thr phosphatase [Gammaproteobacteria bacterium]